MIYKDPPKDWKDLQDKVKEVYDVIGYETYSTKTIKLVRGSKEVDVIAINKGFEPEIKIIVECKYWDKRVPLNEVQAFRTVVSDLGANIGYIVSKNGFQKGAYEAAEFTNIKLLAWDEFNKLNVRPYFINKMEQLYKKYISFTDITETYSSKSRKFLEILDERFKEKYLQFKNKYEVFGFIITMYSYSMKNKYSENEIENIYNNFPISIMVKEGLTLNAKSIEEFIELIDKYHEIAMKEFNETFPKSITGIFYQTNL